MTEGDADSTGEHCRKGESFPRCDGEGGVEVRNEDDGESVASIVFSLLEEEEDDANVADEMEELELERDA